MKRYLYITVLLLFIPFIFATGIQGTLDSFVKQYRNDQNLSIVYPDNGSYEDYLAAASISSGLAGYINESYKDFPPLVPASEANPNNNLVVVGGPCSNKLAEELLKKGCPGGVNSGESVISKVNNNTVLVMGYSADDTKRAVNIIQRYRDFPALKPERAVFQNSVTVREAISIIQEEERVIVPGGPGDVESVLRLASMLNVSPSIRYDADIEALPEKHIVAVGGPCSNDVSKQLLGSGSCTRWDLERDEGLIQVVQNDNYIGIVIAGTDQNGTDTAINSVEHRAQDPRFGSSARIVLRNGPTFRALLRANATGEAAVGNNTRVIAGGPCGNPTAQRLLHDTKYTCDNWPLHKGEAVIRTTSNDTLIVAGTTSSDTERALEQLHRARSEHPHERSMVLGGTEEQCSDLLCYIQSFFSSDTRGPTRTSPDALTVNERNPVNENCYDCFLRHQSKDYISDVIRILAKKDSSSPFQEAERRYIVGKLTDNDDLVCSSIPFYKEHLNRNLSEKDRLTVLENLLFVSTECRPEEEQYRYLRRVLRSLEATGYTWKKPVYRRLLSDQEMDITVKEVDINRSLNVPQHPTSFTLGESSFTVTSNDTIGVQVERAIRDWYSLNIQNFPNDPPRYREGTPVINYMEGNIMHRIRNRTGADAKAITNTLAVSKDTFTGTEWYAMDETGRFRFEVLPDKVHYPATKCVKNICLMVDTHGISALAAEAAHEEYDVVMGCGDYHGKMDAAYYLAQQGINVLYPTDRFASDMIGFTGQGMSLGSAPVRSMNSTAEVGNTPVTIGIDEPIVLQTTERGYPAQYYDAPEKYFEQLEHVADINLDLTTVHTPDVGQTGTVIEKAETMGADVVGIRVAYEEDYQPVAEWLRKDDNHRAVLFHSTGYKPGYRLFKELPEQTTFGDPHPSFSAS